MEQTRMDTALADPACEDQQQDAVPAPVRLVYATDGSGATGAAARFVAQLRLPPSSAVQVVLVLDAQSWQVPTSLQGAEEEWARHIVSEAEAELSQRGMLVTHTVLRGSPAYKIMETADSFKADLIVLGSHGRTGWERLLLGSVAETVARHAGRPVVVARETKHCLRRVVLAVDASAYATRATGIAARLPLPEGAEVTICNVVRPYSPVVGPDYVPDLSQIIVDVRNQQHAEAEQLVAGAAKRLAQASRRVSTCVREGDPGTEILGLAKELEADLIILGARGISPIRALLVGSVADRVLKAAHCSVLLTH